MELHTVLEASLRVGEVHAHAADLLGAAVSKVSDSANQLSEAIASDCCTSNNYPEKDPTPNL